MKHYVLSFIFTPDQKKVLLIHKNRPNWQVGKINGIGGKVEAREKPLAAIVREVKEETNLDIPSEAWKSVGKLKNNLWTIHLYTTIFTHEPQLALAMTDEQIEWYECDNLPTACIDNLTWLIPICQQINAGKIQKLAVEYAFDLE